MGDNYAGHLPFADDVEHEVFDISCRILVERRRWLIEQDDFRRVRQSASNGYALGFSSGQIAHVALLKSTQSDTLKDSGDLCVNKRLSTLSRSVGDIIGHGSRKEIWGLHDHANATTQFFRLQFLVVLTVKQYGAT